MARRRCNANFYDLIKSQQSLLSSLKEVIPMQTIQKPSPLGPREPEMNDAKDRFDRRAQRLQAERDFDRDIKSKS